MKKFLCLNLVLGLALALMPGCARNPKPKAALPVYQEVNGPVMSAQGKPVYVYDQKPAATSQPSLITADQAQSIINRFKEAYPKLGNPRLLIYVNRELVDAHSGMKLVHRDESITSSRGGTNESPTVNAVEKNSYRPDGNAEPTLADKQTVRDVERLFARPLRAGGATVVDQKVASELIADKPLNEFIGTTDSPQGRKDREAVEKIADAVIEILVSSKSLTVTTISGSENITVPDIHATAIYLKDSKILGQASTMDVFSRVPPATLPSFGVPEITEATALALMNDIAPEPK